MTTNKILRVALCATLAGSTLLASQSPPAYDNSAKTASDQTNAKDDLATTAKVRKAVFADKTLSMAAHNVTIITKHGIVTMRGNVKSIEEKQALLAKAREIAGMEMVVDSLSVANSN